MSSYMEKARDPISSLTHLIGAVFFAVATVLLICKTVVLDHWSAKVLVGVILFGCSLVALYAASSIYHFFNGAAEKLLVLLQAGSCYDLCADRRYLYAHSAEIYVWHGRMDLYHRHVGLCTGGHYHQLCWFSAPRWLQTVLYIAMGWAILFDISIFQSMSGVA